MNSHLETLYQKAVNYLEDGEYEQAERLFLEYLEMQPDDAMALNKLGLVYARQRKLTAARDYFLRAVEIDPSLVHALNNLGNIARVEGNLDEAEKYYRQAIAVDPEFSTPHRNLAIVYKQKFRFREFLKERRIARQLEKMEKQQQKS